MGQQLQMVGCVVLRLGGLVFPHLPPDQPFLVDLSYAAGCWMVGLMPCGQGLFAREAVQGSESMH